MICNLREYLVTALLLPIVTAGSIVPSFGREPEGDQPVMRFSAQIDSLLIAGDKDDRGGDLRAYLQGGWIGDPTEGPAHWNEETQGLLLLTDLRWLPEPWDKRSDQRKRINPVETYAASLQAPPASMHPVARFAVYRYWMTTDQHALLAGILSGMPESKQGAPEKIAAGMQGGRMHRHENAAEYFSRAIRVAEHPVLLQAASTGFGEALYRQRRYQEAYDSLTPALERYGPSADGLYIYGLTLIRLGRAREATEAFEQALRLNPYHERAHYYLGNGYTRHTYSELERLYPEAFAVADSASLKRVEAAETEGNREKLHHALRVMVDHNEEYLPAKAQLASFEWEEGEGLEDARRLCFAALAQAPSYGRAHAVFARIQERLRQRLSRHCEDDIRRTAELPIPEIPGIETYIINWKNLPPVIQKLVAQAVEPWAMFVPVLNETGATHFIKPLQYRLSQCPHLGQMADQRIDMDSRLWDDVRGLGGHYTVTGIEDVYRMQFYGYNTVLHELTHQVHSLFTDEEKREIEQLHARALKLEQDGETILMSRYQGLTEWEYFAEGVNAYHSPRRDVYDPREIVRERLFALDTALVRLVEAKLAIRDVTPYYTVGLVNAAFNRLGEEDLEGAWEMLERAPEESGEEPKLLIAKGHLHLLNHEPARAIRSAEAALRHDPDNARARLVCADAERLQKDGRRKALQVLKEALEAKPDPLYLVQTSMAALLWETGAYGAAIRQYQAAAATEAGDPSILFGLAECYADSALKVEDEGSRLDLWHQADTLFREALTLRTGWVELRLAYARLLMQQERWNEAAEQIEEAAHLHPGDGEIEGYRAFAALEQENEEPARRLLAGVDFTQPCYSILWFLKLRLEPVDRRVDQWHALRNRPVRYVFRERTRSYEAAGIMPEWMSLWR
ncbi:tetratricopeptide repeat protein [bacterium]|nr:tetratricopeptide repeat protein [bacterium]